MNRRDFVQRSTLALAAPMLFGGNIQHTAKGNEPKNEEKKVPIDENFVLILSDPHVLPSAYTHDEFLLRLEMIQNLNPLPGYLIFYGDFAWEAGEPESYAELRQLLQRLEKMGIQWDTALGNHDRRETFFEAFPEKVPENLPVPGKYVSIVKTPKADFILLDSLIVGKVEGAVDEEQRQWLDAALSQYQKPVFVGAHHSLEETKIGDLLRKYPCVAGYIHGHHHYWEHTVVDNLPELSLPSSGLWGDIGYVFLNLTDSEALFRLKILDCYKFNTNEPEENRDKVLHNKSLDAFAVPLRKMNG